MLRIWTIATALCGSALAAAFAPAALAQQADAPAADSGQIEDVVVSATRRDEKEHDVPVSTSILSQEQLDEIFSNGSSVTGLAGYTGSLNVESSNGRSFPRFYIRGYGNTDFSAFASQPVEFLLDDVDQENPVLKGFPIFDVQDVQIYRGPQGSLFGRNTPAGVVSIESARPVLGQTSGSFSASDGTYNTSNVDAVLNVPLGDEAAFRMSLQEQRRDDWVHDPITNSSLNGYSDFAGRAQLLYQPNDDFNVLFNVHGRQLDGSAQLFRANIIEPGTNDLAPGFSPSQIFTDGRNTQELGTLGANVRLNWNLGAVSLVSITGYEKITGYFTQGDIDGGYGASYEATQGPTLIGTHGQLIGIPFAVETAGGVTDHDQFTQEVRLQSNYAGPFNWIAGAYYFYETVTAPNIDFDQYGTNITDYNVSRQMNTAPAAFGSLSYKVTPELELRGGARYSYDAKQFKILQVVNQTIAGPLEDHALGHDLSGDASATYAITPDVSVYARFATGFRAPSFGAPSSTVGIQVAKAENNMSEEIGFKTYFFDRRLKVDADVYYFDVKNQQLTAVGGTDNSTRLLNAKNTIGAGGELNVEARLAENLSVRLDASYNHTEIKDASLSVGVCASCTVGNPLNAAGNALISGNPLPQAPLWIIDPSVRYDRPLPWGGEAFLYGDLAYRSKIDFFLYKSTEFTGQGFANLGLKAGYRWNDEKYEVSVFCRNCLDQIRVIGGIDFDNLTGYINEPLIVGAQISARF